MRIIHDFDPLGKWPFGFFNSKDEPERHYGRAGRRSKQGVCGWPRMGVRPMRGVRMPRELEAKITAWIERQPDPKPSRSEVMQRLIARRLDQAD